MVGSDRVLGSARRVGVSPGAVLVQFGELVLAAFAVIARSLAGVLLTCAGAFGPCLGTSLNAL